jgi:hypothetical protein
MQGRTLQKLHVGQLPSSQLLNVPVDQATKLSVKPSTGHCWA